MATLYGREYTKEEILARIGNIEQIAGLKRVVYQEGREAGVQTVQIRTGAGLQLEVLLDRGMDLGRAEVNGVPFSWHSPNGNVAPHFFESAGMGWLRSFAGGMLTTCGLTSLGSPSRDKGYSLDEEHGLHGRISHVPAQQISLDTYWANDQYWMVVKGVIRETAVFGERVQLKREIRACLGSNRIELVDRIENLDFTPIEHMLLYHCNLGYPLVDSSTDICLPANKTIPREPELSLADYDKFEEPEVHYGERVYYHEMNADDQGWVSVALRQPSFPGGALEFVLSYRKDELPEFVQWKLAKKGYYVLGLEPGNCRVEGRRKARENHQLKYLMPMEERSYHLNFDFNFLNRGY